jgi:hypothetical protein
MEDLSTLVNRRQKVSLEKALTMEDLSTLVNRRQKISLEKTHASSPEVEASLLIAALSLIKAL